MATYAAASSFEEAKRKRLGNPALAEMTLPRTGAGGRMAAPEQPVRVTTPQPGGAMPRLGQPPAGGGPHFAQVDPTALPTSTVHLKPGTAVEPYQDVNSVMAVPNRGGGPISGRIAPGALAAMRADRVLLPSSEPTRQAEGKGGPLLVGLDDILKQTGDTGQPATGSGNSSLYAPNYNAEAKGGNSLAVAPEVSETNPQPYTPPPGEEKLLGMNKNALLKGLMATGLSMMDQGGRAYSTPVSTAAIAGRAGQMGMAVYDQEKQNQKGAHLADLRIANADYDLKSKTGGQQFEMNQLKIAEAKQGIEKARADLTAAKVDRTTKDKLNKILDEMFTETDLGKFEALGKRYSAMLGKAGSGDKGHALQQVKEKIKVGDDPLTGPVYMEQVVGYFDPASGRTVRYDGGAQQTQYEEGKVYQDKDGNKAQWLNGKWVDYKG